MYKTWSHHWKDIVRKVFFSDAELKRLMLIPDAEKDNIVTFIQKYFIESPSPDAILTSQDVRINHYDTEGGFSNHPKVVEKVLNFDIYVKSSKQLGVDSDGLVERDRLIFERIRELLVNKGSPVLGVKFSCMDDFPLVCKQEGFSRYHALFTYKKIY